MEKRKKQCFIFILVILVIALFCCCQNNYLSESYYTISHETVDENLAGYKIVQISDLHNKEFGKNQKRLLDCLQLYEPDMIVVTGDLVDYSHTNIEKAMKFIDGAVQLADVYYVTGNHEVWLEESVRQNLLSRLEAAGVHILNNICVQISCNGSAFNLIGLDDRNLDDDTLRKITRQMDKTLFTLLLAHEPQYFDQYASCGVDLVLSGHVHGGQIRLPFVGGLIGPDQGFFPEYDGGLYSVGDTDMVASRGLGNSVIPLRVFNLPEIVYLELDMEPETTR